MNDMRRGRAKNSNKKMEKLCFFPLSEIYFSLAAARREKEIREGKDEGRDQFN
jgi:hypothetical protein